MDKLLSALGAGWVPYAIGVALIAAVLGYTYHLGSSRTEAIWSARYSQLQTAYTKASLDEASRQSTANEASKADETVQIAQLDARAAELDKIKGNNDDAADKDPTANTTCLPDAARMRLNAID